MFFSLLTGCSTADNDNTDYLNKEILYSNAMPLKGELLPAEYMTNAPLLNRYTPHGYMGLAEINGKLVHLSDTAKGEIFISSVHRGRGPKEMLSASYPDYYTNTDKFFAADPFKNIIMEHQVISDTILVTNEYDISTAQPSFLGGFCTASDSTFILLQHRRNSHCLIVLDTNRQVIDSVAYRVFEDERIDHDKVQTLSISMDISPDRKTLVLFDDWYNCLKKYKVDNNRLTLEKDIMFLRPYIDFKTGVPLAEKNHTLSLGKVFLTDKYIYIVSNPETVKEQHERIKEAKEKGEKSSGSPMNNTYLLVFDYDFNFVTSYLCDSHFKWIAIKPDGKTIYASDYKNEYSLRKYCLR